MKTADQWFAEYGESHQNSTNKLIHWICVPLIYFSIMGLLWSIPLPAAIQVHPAINVALLLQLGALLFYFRLSPMLGIGMTVFTMIMVAILARMQLEEFNIPLICAGIFIGAWVGQFIGHNIEGKKPSFFKDLQFLLIGPAWLLHFLYRQLGIRY